jgi:hypothetical protein
VFGCFLDKRKHDQAEELIRDTSLYHIFNALNQEHSKQGDNSKRKDQSNDTFGKCKLWLGEIVVSVKISVFVGFKYFIKDRVL